MGAIFDITGAYRYSLWREWNPDAPRVVFVMLNPSQADATRNDPTIRRCVQFARSWGYGSLEVVNLFAYRTPQPAQLTQVPDPVGRENDRHLLVAVERAKQVIVSWGNWGRLQGRDRIVLALLLPHAPLYCLGVNQSGQPRHPLYCPRNLVVQPFQISIMQAVNP